MAWAKGVWHFRSSVFRETPVALICDYFKEPNGYEFLKDRGRGLWLSE